jgi:hypothetical protein
MADGAGWGRIADRAGSGRMGLGVGTRTSHEIMPTE